MNSTAESNTTEVLLNFGRPHSQVIGIEAGPVANQTSHIRGLKILLQIDHAQPEIGKIMQNHTLLRDPASRLGLQRKLCGDRK